MTPLVLNAVREVDSGVVPLSDTSNYVEVCRIMNVGLPLVLQGIVGSGGALAHLKVTQATVRGGVHHILLEDDDFGTASNVLRYCLPAAPKSTAANGDFQMKLDSSAVEISVWAKPASTPTSLQIKASAPRVGD